MSGQEFLPVRFYKIDVRSVFWLDATHFQSSYLDELWWEDGRSLALFQFSNSQVTLVMCLSVANATSAANAVVLDWCDVHMDYKLEMASVA